MPTKLIPPPDVQTFLRPCVVYLKFDRDLEHIHCLDGSWKTFKDLSSFNSSTFYDQIESRSDDEICLSFHDNHELTIYRVNV